MGTQSAAAALVAASPLAAVMPACCLRLRDRLYPPPPASTPRTHPVPPVTMGHTHHGPHPYPPSASHHSRCSDGWGVAFPPQGGPAGSSGELQLFQGEASACPG
jgi:hypothetical protein